MHRRPFSRHGGWEGRWPHCPRCRRAGNLGTLLKLALPPKAGMYQSPHGSGFPTTAGLVSTNLKTSQSSPTREVMCSGVQDPLWAMAGSSRGQDSRCAQDGRLSVLIEQLRSSGGNTGFSSASGKPGLATKAPGSSWGCYLVLSSSAGHSAGHFACTISSHPRSA